MKILFLGTHGQYNLGDELLLQTFLKQLGREHSFAVNSYDPKYTQNMLSEYQVETFHTTAEMFRFLKYLLSSDLIFFGGGSIIKELYASVGRNRYATLWMILAVVTFAKKLARKKVVMSNIGIGPLLSPGGFRLARHILSQVDFVSVRDKKSMQTYQELGLSFDKLRLTPDAVFVNSPDVFLPSPLSTQPSKHLRITLNLNFDIENPAAWEDFLSRLAEGLQMLNEKRPIEILALPMQSKFKQNDDLSILKSFQKRIPDIPFVLNDPQSAQEVGAIIAQSDLVIAERLHTLVISSILGKPFLGLSYDVKVNELLTYLGMLEHSININQPFSAGELLRKTEEVLNQQAQIHAHLLKRSTDLRAQLQVYFDEVRFIIRNDKPPLR